MLSKLQKLREEREQGFTLIELLVVILIIGILAAIAIPAFLNQRKSAVDSSAESDLKNVATAVETAAVKVKGQEATLTTTATSVTLTPTATGGTAVTEPIKLSNGSTLSVDGTKNKINGTSATAYKISITNPGGDRASTTTGISYDSGAGGIQN